jgi:hypothetical protein
MTPDEIESFFRSLDHALNELPDRPMPVNIDGKVHYLQRTAAWIIPAGLMRLLSDASQIGRLDAAIAAVHCRAEQEPSGSLKIMWDPN